MLDNRLTFYKHLKRVKISKTIGLLRKLQIELSRPAFLVLYKCFVRPHLDNSDAIYDDMVILSFHQKLKSIQCSAVHSLNCLSWGNWR